METIRDAHWLNPRRTAIVFAGSEEMDNNASGPDVRIMTTSYPNG